MCTRRMGHTHMAGFRRGIQFRQHPAIAEGASRRGVPSAILETRRVPPPPDRYGAWVWQVGGLSRFMHFRQVPLSSSPMPMSSAPHVWQ